MKISMASAPTLPFIGITFRFQCSKRRRESRKTRFDYALSAVDFRFNLEELTLEYF